MSTAAPASPALSGQELQCATFYVGDQLMGVDIQQVQEINRHVEITVVPHAPDCVRGVINLRGEVVTVLDLRTVLGLQTADLTADSRNVVVSAGGEKIGLLVDRIADVVAARSDDIELPPANVSGVDGRFFQGVCKLAGELLVILDVEQVLSAERRDESQAGG